jgi:peptide-methionine (S)-S-oxide reductase
MVDTAHVATQATHISTKRRKTMKGATMLAAIAAAGLVFGLNGMLSVSGSKRASTLGKMSEGMKLETATFGAGCFWHVEDDFRQVEGVVSTAVGFEGGTKPKPTYKDVCTNLTDHAEVVQLQFDATKVPYRKLLETFFNLHDPTTLNRQGPDVGTQYRSVIFYHTPEQKKEAEEFIAQLATSGRYKRPIVTQISPASTFWKAEEYHQQYYEKQRS